MDISRCTFRLHYRLSASPMMQSSTARYYAYLSLLQSWIITDKSRCLQDLLKRTVVRHFLIRIQHVVFDRIVILDRLPDPVTLQTRDDTKKTSNLANRKSHSHNNQCVPTQNTPSLSPYTHDQSQEHCKFEPEIQHWDSHNLK